MKILSLILLTICLGYGSVSNSQEKPAEAAKMTKRVSKKAEAKSFIIGAELRSYIYNESRVTHSGLLYGAWGEWYWSSLAGDGKLYGSLLYGTIDYDGYACNASGTNCSPLKAPTTDLIARLATRFDWMIGSNVEIFAGLGYRYLYDKGEGGSFYTRTGQWGFLPLGVVIKGNGAMLEIEYDMVVYGNVKSNISEAISTLPDIESKQSGGSGVVINMGYRINDLLAAYIYYDTWRMPDSESVVVGTTKFTEPQNKSESFGLKLGFLF